MRNITVAVTVDDNMGIAFNKRRQSRDIRMVEDLCQMTDGKIYVSSYSATLFDNMSDKIEVVNDPLGECKDGSTCFIEATYIGQYKDDIKTLIVYRWNRSYPSDKKLDVVLECGEFSKLSTLDFTGNSHDVITKDIYIKMV